MGHIVLWRYINKVSSMHQKYVNALVKMSSKEPVYGNCKIKHANTPLTGDPIDNRNFCL